MDSRQELGGYVVAVAIVLVKVSPHPFSARQRDLPLLRWHLNCCTMELRGGNVGSEPRLDTMLHRMRYTQKMERR
jgi:hypothetical protein